MKSLPPSSLVNPVYRGRQDSFRVLPFSASSELWQDRFLTESRFFLVHQEGDAFPSEEFGEVRWLSACGCSRFRAVRTPHFSRFTSRPGIVLGGGVPHPKARSPCACLPLNPFQNRVSSSVLLSPVYQQAEQLPRNPISRTEFPSHLTKQQTFQEANFPRGVLRSPHLNFVKVATTVSPGFASLRSLRNT